MATVAVLESNMAGNGALAIKAAKSRGYRTLFVCRNTEEYDHVAINPIDYADDVAVVDTYDIAKLLSFFRLFQDDIAVVLAFDDFRMMQAAVINAYLQIESAPSVDALLTVRFKNILRQALKGTPYEIGFHILPGDRTAFSEPLEYPCVIKPVDESGSIGVRICRSKAESDEAIAYILDRPQFNGRGFTASKDILIEDYIEGDEFSAELVWDADNQTWRLLGITKKFVTAPPFCVEQAHIFPYADGSDFANEVAEHANSLLTHIGLKNTFVHMEFKVRDGGFNVIEINPRLGGDMIIELMRNAKGYDAAALMLEANINQPLSSASAEQNGGASAIVYMTDSRPGTVTEIAAPDGPLFAETNVFSVPRQIDGLTSSDDRLGYVILNNDSYQNIEAHVAKLLTGDAWTITLEQNGGRN